MTDPLQRNVDNQKSNVTFVPAIRHNNQMGTALSISEVKGQFGRNPSQSYYGAKDAGKGRVQQFSPMVAKRPSDLGPFATPQPAGLLPNVKVSNMDDAISNMEAQRAEGDAASSRLPQIAEKGSLK